jgi:signal transduction histidine kinase
MDKWLEHFAASSFRRSSEVCHDLKTPLNVAVLNLELLRMRIRKVCGEDDQRIAEYTRSIEVELRRMAKIFDAYFVHASPPKDAEVPSAVDLCPMLRTALGRCGVATDALGSHQLKVAVHESRLSEACRLLADGAAKMFDPQQIVVACEVSEGVTRITMSAPKASEEIELGKIFKFYYTDPSGSPELSLATARVIFETYGCSLDAREQGETLSIELAVPIGE